MLCAHRESSYCSLKRLSSSSRSFLLIALVCIVIYIKNILFLKTKPWNIFFPSKSRYRWKHILRTILTFFLGFNYFRPSWKRSKELDTFGNIKISLLKCAPFVKHTTLDFFSCFCQENWAQLIKRLEQWQCYPPCHGSSHTNLEGETKKF